MNTNLSPNEWQKLSAYIDGQLPDRERRQLEARLKASPELREGLEDLRRTRALLRALPKRRAVRNFTLTPAMIPQKPRRNLFPTLRLVSAFASFLLVMAVASDLIFTNSINNMMSSKSAPQALRQEAPAAAAPSVQDTGPAGAPMLGAEPPTEAFGNDEQYYNELGTPYPEGGYGAGGGGAGTPGEPQTGLAPDEGTEKVYGTPAPTLDATEQARIAMTLAPPGMGGGPLPETGTPPAILAMPAEPMATEQAGDAAADTMRSMAAPSTESNQAAPEATGPSGLVELPPNTFDPRSVLRPAELILAVAAAITGLLAVYFRGKAAH